MPQTLNKRMSFARRCLSIDVTGDLLLVIGIFSAAATTVNAECGKDTFIMDYLLNKTASGYNRQILPAYPVQVRIELWIQEVTSVSEVTQDFEIGIKFFLIFCLFKLLFSFA